MPVTISLTDFADFIMRTGTAQLSKVRELAARGDYHPAFDFWKGPRESIQRFHAAGGSDQSILDQACIGLRDRKKARRHPDAIAQYKRFLGRKHLPHLNPKKGTWTYDNLSVRVNPDLGLTIGGIPHYIKLYFKGDSIDHHKLKLVFALMRAGLEGEIDPASKMAVLDLNNGKLHVEKAPDHALQTLLEAHAKSFLHMWNSAVHKQES